MKSKRRPTKWKSKRKYNKSKRKSKRKFKRRPKRRSKRRFKMGVGDPSTTKRVGDYYQNMGGEGDHPRSTFAHWKQAEKRIIHL